MGIRTSLDSSLRVFFSTNSKSGKKQTDPLGRIMGYAAHRATFAGLSPFNSRATITKARHGMTLYSIQLALNLAWMPLFFGLKRPILATIDILGLIGVNGYLTYLWSTIDETAAYLQAPYMAWLGFATYLCVGSGYLNNWDLSEETPAKRSDRPPRRSERTERTERNDRSERSDRAERGDRGERRRK